MGRGEKEADGRGLLLGKGCLSKVGIRGDACLRYRGGVEQMVLADVSNSGPGSYTRYWFACQPNYAKTGKFPSL